MAWFMTTKVAPQHRETPVLSLKHLSLFCSGGWGGGRKQRNNSDQYNGLEKELGPYTAVYCIALFLCHSHTHRNRHQIHSHIFSNNIYFLTPTPKHIYLICIDSYVI